MSLAETAVLAVELKLAGATQYAAGIHGAEAATAGLNKTVASSGTGLTTLGTTAGIVRGKVLSLGSAVGGMATHFKNVVTGPVGIIGLSAGLFGLAGILEKSVSKAEEFGKASEDLAKVTGLAVPQASALVDVLDKFGISGEKQIKTLGMLERNVGNLTTSQATYNKFLGDFGFSLKDANGHVLDANTLLLKASDYFNGTATASQKAAAMSKLFGRSWQDLIPVLSLGSKGIQQETKDAIHLTDAQLAQLAKFRVAQRDWADSLGDLETLIGVDFLPTLTDGLKGLTSWMETHRDDIRKFFSDGLDLAKQLGAVIIGTIIPTVQGLAGAAKSAWQSIPAPLRDLLVKGAVADRTIHFLFGVSPIQLAAGTLTKALGGILGGFGQRGGTPANPLFVADVTGGLGKGGLPGALPEAAGGLGISGLASIAALAAVPLIPLVAAYFLAGGAEGIATKDLAGRQATAAARGLNPANVPVTTANGRQNPIAAWVASTNKLDGSIEKLRGSIAAGLDGLRPKTPKEASHILKTGAAHDKETSDAITTTLKTKTAKATDIEALRGVISTKLAATERAARAAGITVAAAVRNKDLSVTVPVTVPVSTYINGRLLTSQIGRYSTTQQLQNLAGNLR